RAAGRFCRGRGAAQAGGHQPGSGARRRAADRGGTGPAGQEGPLHPGHAGDRCRDHGSGRMGAGRRSAAGHRGPDQSGRRQGRGPHRPRRRADPRAKTQDGGQHRPDQAPRRGPGGRHRRHRSERRESAAGRPVHPRDQPDRLRRGQRELQHQCRCGGRQAGYRAPGRKAAAADEHARCAGQGRQAADRPERARDRRTFRRRNDFRRDAAQDQRRARCCEERREHGAHHRWPRTACIAAGDPDGPGLRHDDPVALTLSMRLLLVEDDVMVASGVKLGLTDAGYAVDWVGSGERAEEVLKSEVFDAAIIDIGLPRMDGLELTRRLRRPEMASAAMPVLILTARDALQDRVQGLDLGADDYMIKPFELPELLARLRALLRRSQAANTAVLTFGPIELDTANRRAAARRNGHVTAIELGPREWTVLEYLLINAPKPASKDKLLQALTGWDKEITANAVEVYISRLRGKLESHGVALRSIRGFGYRLELSDAAAG